MLEKRRLVHGSRHLRYMRMRHSEIQQISLKNSLSELIQKDSKISSTISLAPIISPCPMTTMKNEIPIHSRSICSMKNQILYLPYIPTISDNYQSIYDLILSTRDIWRICEHSSNECEVIRMGRISCLLHMPSNSSRS